ncbi:hypothetical protein Trco_008447 [Trichoderma cornu-damae]|uniref:Uncharacterized protein n=1 Tax=Trichoderma cornu-damae TaxID=654480 RepID=A0A9P8QJV1_9HYPO|nr:hypothetical protein Trco_008447 [Trichoderma cornu-damae]
MCTYTAIYGVVAWTLLRDNQSEFLETEPRSLLRSRVSPPPREALSRHRLFRRSARTGRMFQNPCMMKTIILRRPLSISRGSTELLPKTIDKKFPHSTTLRLQNHDTEDHYIPRLASSMLDSKHGTRN